MIEFRCSYNLVKLNLENKGNPKSVLHKRPQDAQNQSINSISILDNVHGLQVLNSSFSRVALIVGGMDNSTDQKYITCWMGTEPNKVTLNNTNKKLLRLLNSAFVAST